MLSTGAKLKKLRLEKGLSLEEVHKKTRIHLDILKAIEEDGIINLSPIYIKGFLKIYCDFLEVDPKACIVGYEEIRTKETPMAAEDKNLFYLEKRPYLKLLSLKRYLKPRTVIIVVVILVLAISVRGLSQFIRHKRSTLPRKSVIPAVIATKLEADKKERMARVAKAQPGKAGVQSKNAGAGETSLIRLSMYLKENSWVDLKIDGKTAVHYVLKKGSSESWQAKEKIELSLGNAGGVELEVNTKRISPLGRRGQAVKNIIITKEGLKIK